MRLSASVELYSYGCPCDDGKGPNEYHQLLQSHGYNDEQVGEGSSEGMATRREAGSKPGTSSHVVTYDVKSGSWEHEEPSEKTTKGIGYSALQQHLDEVHGKKAA